MPLQSNHSLCRLNYQPLSGKWARGPSWKRQLDAWVFHQSACSLPKSSRQHKLVFLEQIQNGGYEGVVWCGVRFCFGTFKLKNLKYIQQKSRESYKSFCNNQPNLDCELFSSRGQWLLTAFMKDTTFKTMPNFARSQAPNFVKYERSMKIP